MAIVGFDDIEMAAAPPYELTTFRQPLAHLVTEAILRLVAPAIHEVHFYVIHRALHTEWLYKKIHSVHHNSVNPSPWSSLSMHPVEALLYHAVALWHLVIPSNPMVAMYQLHMASFGAINGHLGFDKLALGGRPRRGRPRLHPLPAPQVLRGQFRGGMGWCRSTTGWAPGTTAARKGTG